MSKFERHPLSALFPEMEKSQQDDLNKDLQENGQRERGMVFEDMILDGWHRYLKMQGKFLYRQFKGSYDDAVKYVISMNLHRRHLTDNQRYCLGAELTEILKKKKSGHNRYTPKDQLLKPGSDQNRTDGQIAKILNVSTSSIGRAIYIKKRDTDVFNKCKTGEISVGNGYTEVRRNTDGVKSVVIDGVKFPDCFSHYIEVENFSREITKKGWACIINIVNGKFEAKFVRSFSQIHLGENNLSRAIVTAALPIKEVMMKDLNKAA